MIVVKINTDLISDRASFHDVFSEVFGFPEFYGRNMDAWIDCMSYIDEKESGMTKLCINKNDTLVIELVNSAGFKNNNFAIYNSFLQCVEFVNSRFEGVSQTRIRLVFN